MYLLLKIKICSQKNLYYGDWVLNKLEPCPNKSHSCTSRVWSDYYFEVDRVFHRNWRGGGDTELVWPDLTKCFYYGNKNKVFGNSWRVYIVFGKNFYLLWLIFMLLGKCSLFKIAKYWKIILPSGHTGQSWQKTFTSDRTLELANDYSVTSRLLYISLFVHLVPWKFSQLYTKVVKIGNYTKWTLIKLPSLCQSREILPNLVTLW